MLERPFLKSKNPQLDQDKNVKYVTHGYKRHMVNRLLVYSQYRNVYYLMRGMSMASQISHSKINGVWAMDKCINNIHRYPLHTRNGY